MTGNRFIQIQTLFGPNQQLSIYFPFYLYVEEKRGNFKTDKKRRLLPKKKERTKERAFENTNKPKTRSFSLSSQRILLSPHILPDPARYSSLASYCVHHLKTVCQHKYSLQSSYRLQKRKKHLFTLNPTTLHHNNNKQEKTKITVLILFCRI